MKVLAVTKFTVLAALGLLATTQASATVLCSGTLTQAIAGGAGSLGNFGSCGDSSLTFSNFAANMDYSDGSAGGGSNPNTDGTDVTVSETTVGTTNNYSVVIDFSGDGTNSALFSENAWAAEVGIQYMVTPTGGATLNMAGVTMSYAILAPTQSTADVYVMGCAGQAFANPGTDPGDSNYASCGTSDALASIGDLDNNIDAATIPTDINPSTDVSLVANGTTAPIVSGTSTNFGAMGIFNDVTATDDGSVEDTNTVGINSVTDKFQTPAAPAVPEPASFLLLGGALVGLGLLRRKKYVA